jgi:hypothetical protein
MTKSKYITMMGRRFFFIFLSVKRLEVVLEEEEQAVVEVLVVATIAQEMVVVRIELHLKLFARFD